MYCSAQLSFARQLRRARDSADLAEALPVRSNITVLSGRRRCDGHAAVAPGLQSTLARAKARTSDVRGARWRRPSEEVRDRNLEPSPVEHRFTHLDRARQSNAVV